MRGRLLAGPASLADYEVVEMLLFLGIPRRDTKPLAKQLILRFGGLREVLAASPDALLGHGVTRRAIDAFRMVVDAVELLSAAEHRAPVTLSNTAALERYLQAVPRSRQHGWSVVLLGSRNQLLGDQPCEGRDADALAGQLLRAALARHATAAILVRQAHAVAGVTQDDRALFMPLRERAAALSVVLHDLVVLGPDGTTASLTQSC